MNHQQVCHVWAQRTKPGGKGNNVFFEGDTIYSYGYHFPIATFIDTRDGQQIVFNRDGYSVSTSKHISYTRRAIPSGTPLLYADTETLKYITHNKSELAARGRNHTKEGLLSHIQDTLSRQIVSRAIAAGNRRLKRKKAEEIESAVALYKDYEALLAAFSLSMPAQLKKQIETLHDNYSKVITDANKERDKRQKELAKREAERQARQQERSREAAARWKQYAPLAPDYTMNDLYQHKPVLLRVHGDNIETSMGAEFPLEHGKRAFSAILNAVQSGNGWRKNGHTIHLGHFQIDEILPDGTVKAGCHTVLYSEIEALAKQLQLI